MGTEALAETAGREAVGAREEIRAFQARKGAYGGGSQRHRSAS